MRHPTRETVLCAWLGATSWLPVAVAAAHGASGDINSLGSLGAGGGYTTGAINDAGTAAVGITYNNSDDYHTWMWTAAGGVVDIRAAILDGNPRGVNNAGVIAGTVSLTPTSLYNRAFRYTPGGSLEMLGMPPGSGTWADASGVGINNAGAIAGSCEVSSNNVHAMRYTPSGDVQDLGVPLGGSNSYAAGMNNTGVVLAEGPAWNGDHAFRYIDGVGMKDLGIPASFSTDDWVDILPRAISDANEVVGSYRYWDADGSTLIWRPFRYRDGIGFIELPQPVGWDSSTPHAISNGGTAVGVSYPAVAGNSAAFLWPNDTTFVNLDAWLDEVNPAAGAEWQLLDAFDISDNSVVLGEGIHALVGGGTRVEPFLLDVSALVPEPSAVVIALAGASVSVVQRRIKRTRRR